MKRIKAYFFFLLFVCFAFTVRASTNTVDYTSQLTDISSRLNELYQLIWDVGEITDEISTIVNAGLPHSSGDYWGKLGNVIIAIKSRCDEFKTLFQSSLSDLESILTLVNSSNTTLQDIETISDSTLTSVITIDNNVSSLVGDLSTLKNLASVLPDLKDQLQSIVDQGELNKEETQMMVLRTLEGITDQADSIKEALDILTQDGDVEEITGAIASLKEEIKAILRLLNTWDVGFFRYLYDRTFPSQSLEFYHISGSPFFENGYLTYNQPIGTTSPYSFVDWLAQVLSAHTQGLQVINDNILFIAKVLGTNAQEQAMSEFQEDADDTVSTISTQYTELINSSGYTPKQFDFSKTKLQNVRQALSGLSGVNSYDAIKVHNLNFASLEMFGFPTQVEYRYDLSETSSFWEVCRAFFTCVWVLLFASVFFMVVRLFYKFYHICFNALAGNRSAGYEVSSIPLHW